MLKTSLAEAMSTITIDAMTQYYETGESPTRQTRHPQAQNFCLLTASGDSITLHLSSSEKFWRCLVAAMERPDLLEDPRFAPLCRPPRSFLGAEHRSSKRNS